MPAQLPIATRSFIKVTEVWIPDKSRSKLELLSGIYGDLTSFESISLDESFAYDEGLPGKAWATAKPVVLKEFTPASFKRTDAAHACGITSGIAIPILAGEFILAVLVFFCGESGDSLGAIEVWESERQFPFDIVLKDGYYGALQNFAYISSMTRFRKGFGLPGKVWQDNSPIIVDDLGHSGIFSRALDATNANITTAIGIPCLSSEEYALVICFLSSKEMPIALRYEIWTPDPTRSFLKIHASSCAIRPDHFKDLEDVQINKGSGVIGSTWLTGTPQTCKDIAHDANSASASAHRDGLKHLVAIPTTEKGELKSVVAWYF